MKLSWKHKFLEAILLTWLIKIMILIGILFVIAVKVGIYFLIVKILHVNSEIAVAIVLFFENIILFIVVIIYQIRGKIKNVKSKLSVDVGAQIGGITIILIPSSIVFIGMMMFVFTTPFSLKKKKILEDDNYTLKKLYNDLNL